MYDQFGTDRARRRAGSRAAFPRRLPRSAGPAAQQIDPEMAQEMFRRMFGGGGGGGRRGAFGPAAPARRRPAGQPRPAASRPPEADRGRGPRPVPDAAASAGRSACASGTGTSTSRCRPGSRTARSSGSQGQGRVGEDIVVKVRVDPHPYFRREGNDVLLDVPISIAGGGAGREGGGADGRRQAADGEGAAGHVERVASPAAAARASPAGTSTS